MQSSEGSAGRLGSIQIDRFLNSLEELNAKFKLVWFRELRPLYQKDTVLSFLHSFMLGYLNQSKWRDEVQEFASPADPAWSAYLHRLTPSFLLMSLENPRSDIFPQEVDLQSKLPSIGRCNSWRGRHQRYFSDSSRREHDSGGIPQRLHHQLDVSDELPPEHQADERATLEPEAGSSLERSRW